MVSSSERLGVLDGGHAEARRRRRVRRGGRRWSPWPEQPARGGSRRRASGTCRSSMDDELRGGRRPGHRIAAARAGRRAAGAPSTHAALPCVAGELGERGREQPRHAARPQPQRRERRRVPARAVDVLHREHAARRECEDRRTARALESARKERGGARWHCAPSALKVELLASADSSNWPPTVVSITSIREARASSHSDAARRARVVIHQVPTPQYGTFHGDAVLVGHNLGAKRVEYDLRRFPAPSQPLDQWAARALTSSISTNFRMSAKATVSCFARREHANVAGKRCVIDDTNWPGALAPPRRSLHAAPLGGSPERNAPRGIAAATSTDFGGRAKLACSRCPPAPP